MRERAMGKPQVGFAARETAAGTYKFQAVVYVAARNGGEMTKTLDPHAKLLTGQQTAQLGYDTTRLVDKARKQRIGLPQFEWRHHAISYQDLWEQPTRTDTIANICTSIDDTAIDEWLAFQEQLERDRQIP